MHTPCCSLDRQSGTFVNRLFFKERLWPRLWLVEGQQLQAPCLDLAAAEVSSTTSSCWLWRSTLVKMCSFTANFGRDALRGEAERRRARVASDGARCAEDWDDHLDFLLLSECPPAGRFCIPTRWPAPPPAGRAPASEAASGRRRGLSVDELRHTKLLCV